jgi:8-oxo-dGTP pyrophosphatase MutT (NUDIX family)
VTELPERYVVNVEGFVVREGRYLMTVRSEQVAHAPGALGPPGGSVEAGSGMADVLEETIRREIDEETGVAIDDEIVYVESKAFVDTDGNPVVDVVFLCRYEAGRPAITRPEEVTALHWLTAGEVLAHPRTPVWTAESLALAERKRIARGW